MPLVKVKATKMSNAKATFISMVSRGANRTPYHIVKQENGMSGKFMRGLDISSILTRKRENPEVVAVVTMKGEGFESVKKQVGELGFSVTDEIEMEDKSVVFKQGDVAEGEGTIIRFNENVALVTKGFTPYEMDMNVGDSSFKDLVSAQGFYPSLDTIMNVASNSVFEIVSKAETPAEASQQVGDLFEEVKKYAQSMAGNLPAHCFKLEKVVPEDSKEESTVDPEVVETIKKEDIKTETTVETTVVVEKSACPDGMDQTKWDAMSDDEKSTHMAKKEETSAPKDQDTQKSLTEEQVSTIVATKVSDSMKELTAQMEGMLTSITKSLKDGIEPLKVSVEDIAGKVTTLGDKVQKQEDAMKGIVVQGGDSADRDLAPVRKAERAGREIDTAFNPSVRARSRK